MNRSLTAISSCVVAALVTSCGPLVYTNYGPNTPLLNQKGETSLTAGVNFTMSDLWEDELAGVSLTGATAIGNNTALAGAFHYSGGKSEDDWTRHSSYWELSAGWFKQKKGPFMFEVYGGPGFGTINNSSPSNSDIKIKFMKPFIQPSIGWRFKLVDLSVTSRFSYVSYTSDRVFYIDQEPANLGSDSFSWDPAFTFRVGKTVKFQYQMCYSTFQSDWEYYNYYQHNWFFSFGISARWPQNR
jgi:hypothetical protein